MSQEIQPQTKVRFRSYEYLSNPDIDELTNTRLKDGDIFKVATLKKNIKNYKYIREHNPSISTRQAIGVFITLKKIDGIWYVYEIDNLKEKISIAKKFRTLNELFQSKWFYGMFYYGNLLDRNVETDEDFAYNNKIIELYKSLFN